MNFLSICSGIEAASVAWESIGWTPIGFSEIDEFPSAVLKHHYQDVPNYGDMTNYMEWQIHEPIDVICGGTPCQAFSVAGQRKSLEDDRGNLSLTFCKIADHFDPEIVIWENVPGVLSTKDNAFGCFLAELAGLSEPILPPPRKSKHNDFGIINGSKRLVAWRVLDAQYFGLAQRRRRVFVVAFRGSGNWRSAAALFPIAESVSRNPKPSREKGQKNTASADRGIGAGGVAKTLIAGGYKLDPELETYIIHGSQDPIVSNDVSHALGRNRGQENVICLAGNTVGRKPENGGNHTGYSEDGVSYTLTATDVHAVLDTRDLVLDDQGGQVMHASYSGLSPTLRAQSKGHEPIVLTTTDADLSTTLTRGFGDRGVDHNQIVDGGAVIQDGRPRRLMPIECERIQGFPDNYTNIEFRGKPAADSHRYKALGNSWATNVARWIGERINYVITQ